jgi:hypothetical protein
MYLEKGSVLPSVTRIRKTHTHTGLSRIIMFNMRCVRFSYACFLTRQGFMCRYNFMAMYNFVLLFREEKFYDVPTCVFNKLGCSAGETFCGILL